MSDKVKCVLALGYFDGVHLGHREVISTAVKSAEEKGGIPIAVTFGGNLRRAVSDAKTDCKSLSKGASDCFSEVIYGKEEKEKLLLSLGVKKVYFAPVTKKFLSKTPIEFLEFLNKKFCVLGYVFGTDYRFGRCGTGSAFDVKEYAKNKNQFASVVELKTFNGEKISSTGIKKALSSGDINGANALLGDAYRITGRVVHGKRVGRTLGFPTANVKIKEKGLVLKHGVYFGTATVDGKEYGALINYGINPTFGGEKASLEAFIKGLNRDIYGRKITLNIQGFIREEKKFLNAEELKRQIMRDLSAIE